MYERITTGIGSPSETILKSRYRERERPVITWKRSRNCLGCLSCNSSFPGFHSIRSLSAISLSNKALQKEKISKKKDQRRDLKKKEEQTFAESSHLEREEPSNRIFSRVLFNLLRTSSIFVRSFLLSSHCFYLFYQLTIVLKWLILLSCIGTNKRPWN